MGFLGYNMFAYCNNNSVVFADYDGYFIEFIIPVFDGLQQMFEQVFYWWESGGRETVIAIGEVIGTVIVLILAEDTFSDVRDSTFVDDKTNVAGQPGSKDGGRNDDKPEVTSQTPPTEKDGYQAPKGGPRKVKTPDGKTGWLDKYGNIWVPAPTGSSSAHGGGHWDVQNPSGTGYVNVYPGGGIRKGKGKPPHLPGPTMEPQ